MTDFSTADLTRTYTVVGMTCAHCVAAVTAEVQALPAVTAVQVSLDEGTLQVTSSAPVGTEQIAAAVDEAGYRLAAS